jgi:hypothetical protein
MLLEDAFGEDLLRRRAARRFLLGSPLFAAALFLAYLPWWPVVVEAAHRAPMAARAPLSPERFGRILSFFSLAAGEMRAPRLSDVPLLLLAAAGAWVAVTAKRARFLAVWTLGGFALIESLGQIHPHYDTPNHFLPAGLAIPPLAALALAGIAEKGRRPRTAALLATLLVILEIPALAGYFRNGRADWRPLAGFLRGRPKSERIFTENQYSELCVAFYVEGPAWLYRGGHLGRDVWNLEGQIVRLTWSWRPAETAWLVIAGEPRSEPLRRWARQFPGTSFPTAEGAILYRLNPALRDRALPAR